MVIWSFWPFLEILLNVPFNISLLVWFRHSCSLWFRQKASHWAFFFFGHVDGKNMVVSKRIQILNRQFNSLIVMQISISTMWALYYANVSNINCWSQSERGSVQFLVLVHSKRIIGKWKKRMPVSMSCVSR